jgi:hypothetical protein
MARIWLNDGKPDESGRLCLEIDPEDGTHPLRVWGRSREEILDKAAKTVEHGQRTISELRQNIATTRHGGSPEPNNGNGTTRPAAGAAQPKPLSAGEQMALTADLSNPAKAPAAITRLVEGHTGLDLTKMKADETVRRIAAIQTEWSLMRPDFPKHATNYKLVNDAAVIRAGGYENITPEILDTVFNELSDAGLLVSAAEDEDATSPDAHPAETPVTVRRPRGAASYRRASHVSPAPAPASQTPKYTRAQIDSMSSAEYRRKLESEPGFAQAVAALTATPAN